MNNIMKSLMISAIPACFISTLFAAEGTNEYAKTRVNAYLNIDVDPKTDELHFIRDTADPDIITKTYVLENADPYEIRSYLRDLVQTKRIDDSDTGVMSVQYNDGTNIVMISAEDYRFDDSPNGEGIDTIVKKLDVKGIGFISGKHTYTYSPKYRSAAEIKDLLLKIGARSSGDETELLNGTDNITIDEDLNLVFIRTAPFSRKTIEDFLQKYDQPYPEVRAKISIYELYAENDTQLGLDFQSWKNNDGIDFFNAGGRFMSNFDPNGIDLARGTGWSNTRYFNFNPKWNTKYIDFLTSKGKAKVVHSSELLLRNAQTSSIIRTTQAFIPTATKIDDENVIEEYIYLPNVVIDGDSISLNAISTNGSYPITLSNTDSLCTLTVTKLAKDNHARYFLSAKNNSFIINGRDCGAETEADFVSVTRDGEIVEFSSEANYNIAKGNRITLDNTGEFGFLMTLKPFVASEATSLAVHIENSSLIGYTADGTPRIQKGAAIDTQFLISNQGTRLLIGGIEKRDIVSVSGGLPFFKDLPGIGWLFSTERESTKRSQLLVVADVIPAPLTETITEENASLLNKVKDKTVDAGEKNDYGYHQFLIDSDR